MPDPAVAVPAAPPAATPASQPAPPAGDGGKGGAPPAPESEGIRNLRTAYDGLKEQYKPWETLGIKPEEAQRSHQVASTIQKSVAEMAKQLGYDEAEALEVFAEEPVKTIQFLQKELAANPPKGPADTKDVEKLVEGKLKEALTPFEKEREERTATKANDLFNQTFDGLAKEVFGEVQVPEAESNLLYDVTTALVKMDREALKGLRDGKTSSIAKYFKEAKDVLDSYYLARFSRETGTPTKPKPGAGGGGKRLSLDEIISSPEKLGSRYAE